MAQTDYEKVVEKLREVGALFIGGTILTPMLKSETVKAIQQWRINHTSLLVVSSDSGECGLYKFVGEPGAPVEDDLKFIEGLANGRK